MPMETTEEALDETFWTKMYKKRPFNVKKASPTASEFSEAQGSQTDLKRR